MMRFMLGFIQITAAIISLAAIYMATINVSLGICLFVAILAFLICIAAGVLLWTYEPPSNWRHGL